MAERPVFMGPRLKRMRRDLGLTQAQMASDLEISPSYVALIERNQRPLTADMLLRLARTYKIDLSLLASDGGAELAARTQAMLKDPMFADIDLPPLEVADVAASYPGITEALIRLYTAYREEQLALADRVAAKEESGTAADPHDPVAEARHFLAARRNCFPALDNAAERIAQTASGVHGLAERLASRHRLRVRHLPPDVMLGTARRLDRHREEVHLSDLLDYSGRLFQLALQLAYLELGQEIAMLVDEAKLNGESSRQLVRRSLASYAAAAIIMPYAAFARAVEARRYDVEAISRLFQVSFEQAAHRLTTLQKPGLERIPFFFIRIDQAGNVSKRLDGAGFPFARHGGACPLWNVHQSFKTPGRVITQWLELPEGQRYFSIARTVNAGGGAFGAPVFERAIALGCAAEHAPALIYHQAHGTGEPDGVTPIGVTCRLCHRPACAARSALPIGREVAGGEHREPSVPFAFADS